MTAKESLEIARRTCEEIEAVFNGEVMNDEEEPMSFYEWLDDALDIEVTHDLRGNYRGARICLGLGGPNVFVDTRKETVDVYWGFKHADWSFSSDAAYELDCIIEEYARDSFCVA